MKAPNLEVNVECLLTTKMTVDIGEEYRLNDLLDNTEYPLRNPRVCLPIQELHLNGFQGKLKGHIFLDGYCTGLLMHSHSDHKYPLQVESPNAISYKNDYGHKWNVLFPFGIPLSKGDVKISFIY